MNTSEKIRFYRLQKGLSQEALANMIGLKKAAVNKYETGRVVNIKRSTLQKLAVALGVSPVELLDDNELDDFEDFRKKAQNSYFQYVAELPAAEALQVALGKDPDIGDYEYTSTQLLEILNFAKFIKERK